MNQRIVFALGALVALTHCSGKTGPLENLYGPDASGSSGGQGASSGAGSSGAPSSSGGPGTGSSSGAGSSSGGSSGTGSSGGASSGGSSGVETPDGGCLGLTTFDGGPRGTPDLHRPQATACDPSSVHDTCEASFTGGGQVCSTHADCAGDGSFNPFSSCLRGHCAIDECLTDSDCPSTQVCSCSSAYYGGNACYHPNLCVPANCHVDSDCGPGGFCSPTEGSCGTVEGYYCHKPTDPCIVPAVDCAGSDSVLSPNNPILSPSCVYSPSVGTFCCAPPITCSG